VPGYPVLVLAALKIDSRFAKAVACTVENGRNKGEAQCEAYARPILVFHALLLAFGVLAMALSGVVIFGNANVFWLIGLLATASLCMDADLFSFVMTESMTVSLYSIFSLFAVLSWKLRRTRYHLLAGAFLGLLCLTRPSFVILMPVTLTLTFLNDRQTARENGRLTWRQLIAFAAACLVVLGPWIVRNQISVGKWGLTEEYGAAALIERFAYNTMSVREMVFAFPYCVPGIGDVAFDQVHGNDFMHRFVYHTSGSFFHIGRGRRDALVKQHTRLDPLIAGIVLEEMRTKWWRHLLVSVPLAWCGMWVGWMWGLVLIPLFGWASVKALRKAQPLLLFCATPAVVMLGVHALVANHYTRYNLILIGPLSIGAAWVISAGLKHALAKGTSAEKP